MSWENREGPEVVNGLMRRFATRRTVLRSSIGLVGAGAVGSLLAACGGSSNKSTTTSADQTPTTASASGSGSPAAGQTPAASGGTAAATATESSSGSAQKGGTLVVAFNADPESLDPHITTALLAARVLALIHDNLVDQDYDGSFKPALSEKWDISSDGLEYTFTLKKGVKFHSGKDFTADDVKYTYERWLNTDKSPTSYTIKPISSIDVVDPQTVKFTLSEPYNIFLDQVAGSWAVILNKDAVDKAGQNYGVTSADGTGPYKFDSWTRNDKLALKTFSDYNWGSAVFQNQGPAYVDGIEIRVIPEDNTRVAEFQSGNIHLLQDVPAAQVEQLSSTPGVSIVKYDQLQTTYLGMNTAKPPVDDVNVRMAINYALNRDEIVKGANFGLGTAATTMLAPKTPYFWQGSQDIAPKFDLDKAKSLLDQAGWTAGSDGIREKNGTKLTLPLWVINDSTTVLQAQIIEQQLSKAGIKVDTKQYEQTAWFAAARSGDQVGYIIGVFYSNADVLYFYFYSKQQPAPNRFSYSNADVDKWLLDSRSNTDKNQVTQDYQNIQKQLIEDAPAAPLIHSLGTLGKEDSVQGVKVHPSRWLYRMLDISIKK